MRLVAHVFGDVPFFAYSKSQLDQARSSILQENPDYILNVNETEYLQHLESRFHLDPIAFDLAQMTMETEEQDIAAGRFPPGFAVTSGKSYKKQAFIFHVPFSGTPDLLRCIPSQSYAGVVLACEIRVGEILFEIVDMYGDGNRVRQDQVRMTTSLEQTANWLKQDVTKYNQAAWSISPAGVSSP